MKLTMAILYLTEQQAWVGREGDCLVVHVPERNEDGSVKGKRERKMTVPLFKIEEVMVFGDITLSTPALASLLEGRIQVTYLSKYGRFLGNLSPQLSKNSILRLAQHTAHANPCQCHTIAQRFVTGKLRNMRTVLLRYQRSHQDYQIGAQIETLTQCIKAASQTGYNGTSDETLTVHEIDLEMPGEPVASSSDRMNGLGSLLGCEGAGSAAYFSVFERLINVAGHMASRNASGGLPPIRSMLYSVMAMSFSQARLPVPLPALASIPISVICTRRVMANLLWR